jgi:NAD(P)-dependent dehydrogenase (short-subunit alcohol dehydrogenase family)
MAQVWLVTGSSRGLGRAIVEAGLAAGNKVLATARDKSSLYMTYRSATVTRSSSSRWT